MLSTPGIDALCTPSEPGLAAATIAAAARLEGDTGDMGAMGEDERAEVMASHGGEAHISPMPTA